MALELFGFSIAKKESDDEKKKKSIRAIVPKPNEDAAVAVNEGGVFGTSVDLNETSKNEAHLITRYRDMAAQPECDRAIDDIVNEAIILSENKQPVSIVLDNLEGVSDNVKNKLREEFDYILKLLKFNTRGYDIFKNWYVDGRLYYELLISADNPIQGIKEIRYIDPRKIKKVRSKKKNVAKLQQYGTNILAKEYNEYFIYAPKGVSAGSQGVKVAPDAIAFCHSGILDKKNTMVLSYLNKAIKPLNLLRNLEDATVIYRLARAPERRIFYLDVGNLPKPKAEQYLRDMMTKHKNKMVYDANTGEVKDDRKFLNMLEDYWLPRREGGRGTQVDTLSGGQNLGEIDDILYFQKKLYESLNVPFARLDSEAGFNLGRASEISRDEVKFNRFIGRLRNRFAEIFQTILEKQLVLKEIITRDEWEKLKGDIFYDFVDDNHFSELKDAEILESRISLLNSIDELVGRYYSIEWARKNILKQSEDEIKEIDKQIKKEGSDKDREENDGGGGGRSGGGRGGRGY